MDAGVPSAFLNAYPSGWPGPRGGRRIAGPPLAAQGAGLLTRTHVELGRREAVASEMTNAGWKHHFGLPDLPEPTAREAGRTAARLAGRARLSLFAHYSTDTAGHRGGMEGAIEALERVDAFLGGLLDERPDDLDLLICSDHGNLEDVTTGHTRNPSLGVVVGEGVRDFDPATLPDLTRIPAFVLRHAGVANG